MRNPFIEAYKEYKSPNDVLVQMMQDNISVPAENIIEYIQFLQEKNEDINATDYAGRNVLYLCRALSNPRELAKALKAFVEAGGDINVLDKNGRTPFEIFFFAYLRKEVWEFLSEEEQEVIYDFVKQCLDLGVEPNKSKLIPAIIKNIDELIMGSYVSKLSPPQDYSQKLIDFADRLLTLAQNYGADINKIYDDYGLPAVVYNVHHNLIALLLEHGADPNIIYTPNKDLDRAEYNEYAQVISQTPLIDAVKHQDVDLVKIFLEAGADPNLIPDEEKGPALFYLHFSQVCDTCDSEFVYMNQIAELLIQYGANPNIESKFGGYLAYTQKYLYTYPSPEIIKHLDDVNTADEDGMTPLHYFTDLNPMEYYNEETKETVGQKVLSALLERGANPNAINNEGETPFAIMCRRYAYLSNAYLSKRDSGIDKMFSPLLHDLVRAGAEINVPAKKSRSAIELLPKKMQETLKQEEEYRKNLQNTLYRDADMFER